jgi:pimeloyl-ACP methyl ester carboxylesterase
MRTRNVLIMLACACFFTVVWMYALQALFARQEGLGVGPAAARALHDLARKLPPVLVGYSIGLVVVLVFLCRKPDGAGTPAEAGRMVWKRLRSFVALSVAPFLLIAAAMMIYHLATDQWQDLDWILALLFVIFSTVLVGHLLHRPGPERLYVLGTGDASRVNDERAQAVRGKASETTLGIFAGVLVLGGTLYETLVLGSWPILTGSAVIALICILGIATSYWNRRL